MNGAACFLLVVLLLMAAVHRLPAPIIEESPTPRQSASPQLKPGEKWKPQTTQGQQASPTETPSPSRASAGAARFAGTWVGKIKLGSGSGVEFTLVVSADAMSLIQKSKPFGEHSHATTATGDSLSWMGGRNDGFSFTLTPSANGQTAVLTAKPPTGPESRATFKRSRLHPSQGKRQASPARKLHPGTKLKHGPGN
jgi:hypothetical protein